MNIIIVQGMPCLGKSTLCKQLEKDIPNCKHFCVDKYKEHLWDELGFDSIDEREKLADLAKELFYKDINDTIEKKRYDYILLDYKFSNKYLSILSDYLLKWNLPIKTIYLKPENLEIHKRMWQKRCRDFSIRHAGHGATQYHNGAGKNYVNIYESNLDLDLPTFGDTLNIDISFVPYSRSESYDNILSFIKEQHID